MSEAIVWLTIFVLSVFVGIEVISKVSSTLHTPLMSGANSIHGIVLVGSMIIAASATGFCHTPRYAACTRSSARSCAALPLVAIRPVSTT